MKIKSKKLKPAAASPIELPEIIIVLSATALADLAELIPLFGAVFGSLISGAVILWSCFRGMYTSRRRATKTALVLIGPFLEIITAGLFPETITLAIAIFIHNRDANKT